MRRNALGQGRNQRRFDPEQLCGDPRCVKRWGRIVSLWWLFNKAREPLFGKDIETWAVVALPKRLSQLDYDVRFYFNARTAFFGTRRQSDWMRVHCQLSS